MARYCVRCTFLAPSNLADADFLEALALAGLMRLAPDGMSFDLLPPASVSLAHSGHWASITADRLASLRDDWTVSAESEGGEVN